MMHHTACSPSQQSSGGSALRIRERVRRFTGWLLIAAVSQFLVACGGGGGGGNRVPPTGSVLVTVVDDLDGPVGSAQVSITSGSSTRSGTTNADGTASISGVSTGSASISVTAAGFEDGTGSASVTANQQAAASIALARITEPAAGLFTAQITEELQNTDGQNLTFVVEVLVVDDDSATAAAIETLTAADFTLQPCSDSDPNVVECLRGPGAQADVGYSVSSATPGNFELVAGQAANPYAATLMIDQSASIRTSDPSNARLFAAKVFLNNLGGNDFASVSAFADDAANADAEIPDQPVTRISGFLQSNAAQGTFGDIDILAQQVGGGTPLLNALDAELDFTAANAPTGQGQRRAVVLFSDGEDTTCMPTDVPPCGVDESIQKSIDLDVDIFTVGLGDEVDVDVLRRLAEGGRGFYLFAENAQQLFPIYRSLGELLSRTLSTYRMEWTIQADAPATYEPGQTILGTLLVDTGSNQINLPLRVFLPETP